MEDRRRNRRRQGGQCLLPRMPRTVRREGDPLMTTGEHILKNRADRKAARLARCGTIPAVPNPVRQTAVSEVPSGCPVNDAYQKRCAEFPNAWLNARM